MPDEMVERIQWLGHDTFLVQGSKIVYFDPWDVSGDPKADLILISHDHFDHCSPEDVAKIVKSDTVIVTEPQAALKLSGDVRTLAPGQSLDLGGVKVRAVPAYNLEKNFHPKTNNWLGFIVELDGTSIYHLGDTDHIPEMKDLEVDIALVPVSGTYVMDVDEAVAATRAIHPKIAIPMHYAKIVGTEDDPVRFAQALKDDDIRVVVKTKA